MKQVFMTKKSLVKNGYSLSNEPFSILLGITIDIIKN